MTRIEATVQAGETNIRMESFWQNTTHESIYFDMNTACTLVFWENWFKKSMEHARGYFELRRRATDQFKVVRINFACPEKGS